MVTRIVLLTSNDTRHAFFRMALSLMPQVEMMYSICEEKTKAASTQMSQSSVIRDHFTQRARKERDFFGALVDLVADNSQPINVRKNAINEDVLLREKIKSDSPDVLVCYGASIIREPLLSLFEGKFLNIHLGLSPYYRGSGTNFWPVVNGEPEFIGVTFMQIDAGIDTGDVVHQIRPTIYQEDSLHDVGTRLIREMVPVTADVASCLSELKRTPQSAMPLHGWPERTYRRRDLTDRAIVSAQENVDSGIFIDYLESRRQRDAAAPIVSMQAVN